MARYRGNTHPAWLPVMTMEDMSLPPYMNLRYFSIGLQKLLYWSCGRCVLERPVCLRDQVFVFVLVLACLSGWSNSYFRSKLLESS